MCWHWSRCVYPASVMSGLMVSLLQRVTLYKRLKGNRKRLPLHTDPRFGSDFPRSGVAPGAAARGRPWPRAAYSASLPRYPPTQRLCSASWKRGLAVIRQSIHPKSQRQIKIPIGAAGTRSLVREGGLSDTSPITTHKSQPGLLRDLPRSLHILAADMPANGTEG